MIASTFCPFKKGMTLRISVAQKKQLKKSLEKMKGLFAGNSKAQGALETLLEELVSIEASAEDSSGGEFSLDPKYKERYDWFGFSDGACRGNPGPGAWGSVIQRPNEEVIFEGSGVEVQTTNNRMELQGAIEVLKFLLNEGLYEDGQRVILYSDSKYVVDGLTKWVSGWKKRGWKKADKKVPENVEYWQELDHLAAQFSELKLHWVKGHAGHPQNEHCDQLANKALDEAGF